MHYRKTSVMHLPEKTENKQPSHFWPDTGHSSPKENWMQS
jgi:hypothetical protein